MFSWTWFITTPILCAQADSGKVKGHVFPSVKQVAEAAIQVDAQYGFAYPAMEMAIENLCEMTPKTGVAVAVVRSSHHCGAAGYHVERLAENGLVGLLSTTTSFSERGRTG